MWKIVVMFVMLFSVREAFSENPVELRPRDFRKLPLKIVEYLESHACMIPQSFIDKEPHNVIQGQFQKPGQLDWALLCSKNGLSSIIVFWNGTTTSIDEIGKARDSTYFQDIDGKGTMGYSRYISPVGSDFILEQYARYGGPKPPPIQYQGINDAFVEKASIVLYFHENQWMELTGSD